MEQRGEEEAWAARVALDSSHVMYASWALTYLYMGDVGCEMWDHVMYASWALTYSRLIMWLAISTIEDATAAGIWPARICLNMGLRWRRHCWYLR